MYSIDVLRNSTESEKKTMKQDKRELELMKLIKREHCVRGISLKKARSYAKRIKEMDKYSV